MSTNVEPAKFPNREARIERRLLLSRDAQTGFLRLDTALEILWPTERDGRILAREEWRR